MEDKRALGEGWRNGCTGFRIHERLIDWEWDGCGADYK